MARWLCGATVAIACAVVSTAAPARGEDQASSNRVLRVERSNIDLGQVRPGGEVAGTFIFHNQGDREVRILSAKPS